MYFDYAATTPPNPEVLKTFETVNRDFWANPHALHRPGLRAESLLEHARKQVLSLLGAEKEYRCIFTSGATESNNMALKGIVQQYRKRGNHIITSAAEHPSVLEVCRFLESEGYELTVLPVNSKGSVEADLLQKALRPETILVSLMHVNNEIGAINDIMKLGTLIKKESSAMFHVDAAQSIGKIPLSLNNSPIDLLTFSAHKFFGLKGSGALLFKTPIQLPPMLHGGGQEDGFRSGTADAAQAAALAKALRLSLDHHEETRKQVMEYKKKITEALSQIPRTNLNGTIEEASPFIINCSISGIRPETILQALAEKEIYISTVSACSARKTAESTVVLALTGSHERAQTSIRISLSALTTQKEIDTLCSTLGPLIKSLR